MKVAESLSLIVFVTTTSKNKYRLIADVSSLFETCQQLHGKGSRLDFDVIKDIIPALYGPDDISLDFHAYIITHPNNLHTNFQEVLEAIGYTTHELKMKFFPGISGPIYARWDVGITLDLIRDVDQYDEVVLVVGETDYSFLIEYLIDKHKKVHVLSFDTDKVKELNKDATELYFLQNSAIYVKDKF